MIVNRSRQLLVFSLIAVISVLVPGRATYGINLEQAYETALKKNEEVYESLQMQHEARDRVTEAKSRLYPHLELSGFKVRQKELSQLQYDPLSMSFVEQTFQHERDSRYQLELRHHLYTGGKTWSGWSIRELEAKSEAYRHYRRKQEVLFEVARRYYGVLLAQRNLEIARNTLERSRSQLSRAEGRYDVGEITQTGVLRAEVSASRAEQQLQRAKNNLTVAYEQLALATGMDTIPEEVESVEFKDTPDSGIEELYELAFNNRRDIKRIKTQKKVSSERLEWERADYYPNLDFVSQYENRDKPRFSSETEDWSVRLVGTYPIFSGWSQTSEINQAHHQFRASKARHQRLKKRVKVEIKNLYLELRTQEKVINTAQNEVGSARQNYDQITAEFEQGLVSSVDVNDALTTLQEAESRLANARYNFQLDLIRLKLSTGVFQEDRLRSVP